MSPRLPPLKPKEVLHALAKAGFVVHHTPGSHYILKHPDKPALRVTVPSITGSSNGGRLIQLSSSRGSPSKSLSPAVGRSRRSRRHRRQERAIDR
ncbi:type II toxin-antitoxin system HicA family toxin [Nitrospira moscoviensis]|uniref:YcfA family protein (Modular protein) n=1 Tax=Nitrospira moscoviensis TaxID=42253 RepID=A0A0K2GJ16_NITMO|nr:YcfA family protein (modular protein) [Nitrospira moscoviensis]